MGDDKMKLYQIYDGEVGGLFDNYPEVKATTGKEAILKHLAKTGRKYKLKRSKDNDVVFKAQAIYYREGTRYRLGNAIWYKKISKKNN